MNKLFGTSKKKEEAPKSNINAPTLGETSGKVSITTIPSIGLSNHAAMFTVGPKRKGDPDQG